MITAEDIKKLQEIGAWLSNQRGMLCRDFAKDLARILIKIQQNVKQ